ncbi:D-ribose-binding periplasmic protein precursor [Rubripirellula lacrimiformis]|uniref:D-ribose-binding periplasmic protein n=1 Tax=Rubripirellula lacrimiformis TaxID=1930273 RepID=A0A517N7K7_9BACT|nr:sugar-binding protein [Rubripirellula lacrimiformis]QDT03129.1 D-ribose-binding periplasmic protein precursor [Rubripirellula lacrimiformis]
MKRTLASSIFLFPILALTMVGCSSSSTSQSGGDDDRPSVAYVTNGVASFWVIAEAGVHQGGKDFDANVDVLMPAEGISDQKRIIEDLITKGTDGIAISPIDPDNQNELINRAAKQAHVITQDSDAPDSDRQCYIGMDNYLAGRMCGDLVTEALPDGGKVAIFIGRLEQDNARRRRQGVIDAILGRSEDPTRFDPPDADIQEGKWHIVGTYTDQFDRAQGKANAEDAMSRHSDLAGMVGLFAYNPPLILEALGQADKLGKIKVIAFDEANETLQGIVDGNVHGTVVQNPFEYGRQSVRILAGLTRGQTLAELEIPENGFLNIPASQIRRDNIDEYWDELKKNLGEE